MKFSHTTEQDNIGNVSSTTNINTIMLYITVTSEKIRHIIITISVHTIVKKNCKNAQDVYTKKKHVYEN